MTTSHRRNVMHRIAQAALVASSVVLMMGCSTWDNMSGAEKGTAVGAAVGGVAGNAVIGGPVGTVGGAVAGGVVGHEVGKDRDRR